MHKKDGQNARPYEYQLSHYGPQRILFILAIVGAATCRPWAIDNRPYVILILIYHLLCLYLLQID